MSASCLLARSSIRASAHHSVATQTASATTATSKVAAVGYKNIAQLRRFISDRGKIKGRGFTGACRKHQNQVAVSIKRAREMALLPYVGDSQEPQTRPRSSYAE